MVQGSGIETGDKTPRVWWVWGELAQRMRNPLRIAPAFNAACFYGNPTGDAIKTAQQDHSLCCIDQPQGLWQTLMRLPNSPSKVEPNTQSANMLVCLKNLAPANYAVAATFEWLHSFSGGAAGHASFEILHRQLLRGYCLVMQRLVELLQLETANLTADYFPKVILNDANESGEVRCPVHSVTTAAKDWYDFSLVTKHNFGQSCFFRLTGVSPFVASVMVCLSRLAGETISGNPRGARAMPTPNTLLGRQAGSPLVTATLRIDNVANGLRSGFGGLHKAQNTPMGVVLAYAAVENWLCDPNHSDTYRHKLINALASAATQDKRGAQ